MEFRWAEGESDRLPALAADLVSRSVSLIAAGGNVAVQAAKGATSTIPIVFTTSSDPVQLGFVASLSRPGGNLTGVTSLNVEVGPKRLELMRELVPTVRTMALLVNPTNPNTEVIARELQASARILGLKLHVLRASSEREIEEALSTLSELRVGGLLIGSDLFFNIRSEQIAKSAFSQAVPAIFQYREFAAAGGLMSYGGSSTDLYRQAGVHAGKILRGEKPADLPVQQSTKVELIINLRTAKALGLTVPLTLLGRADEVIE
jgi:putative ABC transport system substrate-binding protein